MQIMRKSSVFPNRQRISSAFDRATLFGPRVSGRAHDQDHRGGQRLLVHHARLRIHGQLEDGARPPLRPVPPVVRHVLLRSDGN